MGWSKEGNSRQRDIRPQLKVYRMFRLLQGILTLLLPSGCAGRKESMERSLGIEVLGEFVPDFECFHRKVDFVFKSNGLP